MRANAERAAADVIGLQADQRQGEEGGDQRRKQSILKKRRPQNRWASGLIDGEPGGSRH